MREKLKRIRRRYHKDHLQVIMPTRSEKEKEVGEKETKLKEERKDKD